MVNFSDLAKISSFRFDAEYYHPNVLEYESKIVQKLRGCSVKELGCKVVSGPFGSALKSKAYTRSGVPFIRISDIRSAFIAEDNLAYISEDDSRRLNASALKPGDIVLSKVGNTLGIAAIVTSYIGRCNISENNFGIVMPKDMPEATKYFLAAYLNSKPGQSQIVRALSGNAQPKLNVSDIEELKVPHVSEEFANIVQEVLELIIILHRASERLYAEAETMLLSILDLDEWNSTEHPWFTVNYSQLASKKRFDAEYHHPRYSKLSEAIQKAPGGWSTLGKLVEVQAGVEVGSEEYASAGIPFVRVSNVKRFGFSEEKYISEELYSRLQEHQPQKGEILLTKDGTPGIAFNFTVAPPKMIISSGLVRLKLKNKRIDPDYLTLVLNSLLTKAQITKDVGGSIIQHWRPEVIKETEIPLLPLWLQKGIATKVIGSITAYNQAQHLFTILKRSVETVICESDAKVVDELKIMIKSIENDSECYLLNCY